jgi:sigma-E factor negative regulatory protein RseB
MARLFPAIAGRRLANGVLAMSAFAALGLAAGAAAGSRTADPRPGARGERTVNEWLTRMHDASRQRNYVGTFVVSSGGGSMSSSRIWHACDGQRQVERVDSLSGERRSTFRKDDEVLTFLPESRTVRSERRESLGLFPELMKPEESAISEYYTASRVAADRVAGFEADVVQVLPKDALRFGYRIWSEKKSGLVVKVQTLDDGGNVLEQAAFSELQLDAPVRMERLAQMMTVPEGWRVEKTDAIRTNAAAEGWALKAAVAGFKPMNCYKRPSEGVLQWTFSDGLASVSLFVEAYDRQRHAQEGVLASGATNTLTRRVGQDWWVTAVGEVPAQTLKAFAVSLERRR